MPSIASNTCSLHVTSVLMYSLHLEDVLSGALEGLQLPLVDRALSAAADQVRIVVRPPQAPHLAIVAPVQCISYDMQAHACKEKGIIGLCRYGFCHLTAH